jgi:double-stranded uracil-DNA glycosylase
MDLAMGARRDAILPDLLRPGLRIVFCGTAAGTASARAAAYFAGPGNAFWSTLHDVGLTPRRLRPAEYRELLMYGIGLTDVCKVRFGSDRDVGSHEFDVERLIATLERHAPAWIAFNGKNAARAALGRPVQYGEQAERCGPARAFVLPSTFGAARRYWDVRHWRRLAERV